jgi:Arc/MetJ-type ribon-helix-helix transcriptional regulator
MAERDTTRVQLELPPSSMARLKALREKTEAASYAEVLRNALRLYEAMIEEAERGNDVIIRRKQGEPSEIKVFL